MAAADGRTGEPGATPGVSKVGRNALAGTGATAGPGRSSQGQSALTTCSGAAQAIFATAFAAQHGMAQVAGSLTHAPSPPEGRGEAQLGAFAFTGIAARIRASVSRNLRRRSNARRTKANLLHNSGVDRREFLLRRIRVLLVGFVVGVVLAGVTAFPLTQEAIVGARLMGAQRGAPGMSGWIALVRDGLVETDRKYPFIAYGTDWLAFGHLMIAAAFWGPIRDPVRNVSTVRWGVLCCVASVPVALVCGPLRGVPPFWLPIDCAFGLIGIVPLLVVLRDVRELESLGPDA